MLDRLRGGEWGSRVGTGRPMLNPFANQFHIVGGKWRSAVRHAGAVKTQNVPHQRALVAIAWDHHAAVCAALQNCRQRIQSQTILFKVRSVTTVASRGQNRTDLGSEYSRPVVLSMNG